MVVRPPGEPIDLSTATHPQIPSAKAPEVLELSDGTRLVLQGPADAGRRLQMSGATLCAKDVMEVDGAPFGGYVRTGAAGELVTR